MPRDHARVNVTIWNDPDFRALPPACQHLYFLLWTSPDLSYCGVHDWRPGRLARLSAGFSAEHITTVGASLRARHFLVVDEDTEEVLVRSWMRFDGLLKQPRMAVSMVYAYASLASPIIRAVVVHELHKIHEEEPGLSCWRDERVAETLAHPSVSAKDLPTPEDPFTGDVGPSLGMGLGMGLPQTEPKVYPSVWDRATPTPTPTPNSTSPSASRDAARKRPARRLPDDFEPTEAHRELASSEGVDLDREFARFVDYWRGEGKAKVDWNATLRNWIRRAADDNRSRPAPPADRRVPNAPTEAPPDGLEDHELAAWYAKRRA